MCSFTDCVSYCDNTCSINMDEETCIYYIKRAERDKRDLIGKICVFNTDDQDSDYIDYNGEQCVVKNRVDEDTYDFECDGTMYNIKLLGDHRDTEIEVFADEIELMQEVETYSFL